MRNDDYSGGEKHPELSPSSHWEIPACNLNNVRSSVETYCEKDTFAGMSTLFNHNLLGLDARCSAYESSITTNIKNAQQKLLELSSEEMIPSSEKLDVINETAHASNRLLEISRNKIWKIVKNKFDCPDKSVLVDREEIPSLMKEAPDRYDFALNVIASTLLDRSEFDLKFEIDIDEDDCVIVNWLFESGSYEWTIVNDNSPWPMIKIYEFSNGIFETDQENGVKSIHNIASLLEKFRTVVSKNM